MRIASEIERIAGRTPALGFLNINLYRDDRVTHELPESQIPVDSPDGTSSSSMTYCTPDVRFARRSTRSPIRAAGRDPALRAGRPRSARAPDSGRLRRPVYADVARSARKGRPLAAATPTRMKSRSWEPPMRIRRSLLDLDDLTAEELAYIFDRTTQFEQTPPGPRLAGKACVNMFFEESTRTFTSFNLAELRLGADVVNLAPRNLSLASKGETLEDTAITLGAMGISVLVVRHPQAGFPAADRAELRRPRDQRRRRRARASDASAARHLHADRRVRRSRRAHDRDRRRRSA